MRNEVSEEEAAQQAYEAEHAAWQSATMMWLKLLSQDDLRWLIGAAGQLEGSRVG